MTLIDERETPSMRQLIGQLLSNARTADIALAHLRLAGLDLDTREVENLERCRLLIGRFNADQVVQAEQSRTLSDFAQSGRLQLRTAPHHAWSPDFSIFRHLSDGPDVLLFGAHYFARPYPLFGLALTYIVTEPADLHRCTTRFEELWAAGYDVLPSVSHALRLR